MYNDIPHVIEIIRRIHDGTTKPFLCRCDDDNLYVVKGMPCVPNTQLIAEWISACLAQSIGLSIPEFKIVYVEQSLTEFVPDWNKSLSEGYAFATRFIEGVSSITFSQAHNNVDEHERKRIYLFDKWINNSDRNLSHLGGNVNIIFDYKNNKHYLIDHNLAFDHDEVDGDFDYHVYSEKHRTWEFDLVDRQIGEDETRHARSILSEAMSYLPEEWRVSNLIDFQIFCDLICTTLARADTEEFWSKIK